VCYVDLDKYYAEVFLRAERELVRKYISAGKFTRYEGDLAKTTLAFADFSNDDMAIITRFGVDFKKFVLISLNNNIVGYFSDELDSCVAVDYIYSFEEKCRTDVGELFYRAKYKGCKKSMSGLCDEVVYALRRNPYVDWGHGHAVAYIPPVVGRAYYVPREIARYVCESLHEEYPVCAVDSDLVIGKPNIKNLKLHDKIQILKSIFGPRNNVVFKNRCNERVDSVILIDDAYQSGATMWAYAGFLKSLGCKHVHGVVCVKNMRDTDNIGA
jgi:hypothetical protein